MLFIQNVTAIYEIVKIFQSRTKWWTDGLMDIATPKAMSLALLKNKTDDEKA